MNLAFSKAQNIKRNLQEAREGDPKDCNDHRQAVYLYALRDLLSHCDPLIRMKIVSFNELLAPHTGQNRGCVRVRNEITYDWKCLPPPTSSSIVPGIL